MSQANISKQQLIDQLTAWQQGKKDNEELQDWMVTHYDPDEVSIGQGE